LEQVEIRRHRAGWHDLADRFERAKLTDFANIVVEVDPFVLG